jgi:hypothetical protein
MDLKEIGLDSSGSGLEWVAGSCKHSDYKRTCTQNYLALHPKQSVCRNVSISSSNNRLNLPQERCNTSQGQLLFVLCTMCTTRLYTGMVTFLQISTAELLDKLWCSLTRTLCQWESPQTYLKFSYHKTNFNSWQMFKQLNIHFLEGTHSLHTIKVAAFKSVWYTYCVQNLYDNDR